MLTSWNMGAIRNASSAVKVTKSPSVMTCGGDLARAHVHDDGAHHAHQNRGRKAHERSRGQAFQNVVEQPLHAALEHRLLARFGMIALDHAHAAQRFGEPSRHFGIDLAALAENRPDGAEGFAQNRRESDDDHQRNAGQQRS